MDIPPEVDRYIKEMIEHSLDLPVSSSTLSLKLLASKDALRRLQDKASFLEERLMETTTHLDQCKAEVTMTAQGLKRCVEEKESAVTRFVELTGQKENLEKERVLHKNDIKRLIESCDDFRKENEELRTRLNDCNNVIALVYEIESLKKDKEHLRVNLLKAEEEVELICEEKNMLDRENEWLHKQVNKEKREGCSDGNRIHKTASGFNSEDSLMKGKRKSFRKKGSSESVEYDGGDDSIRHPLSPLQSNSPDSRKHKN